MRAKWSQHATGGSLVPLMLVARYSDNNNYYRAELVEDTNHSVHLAVSKVVGGTYTRLKTSSNIGTDDNNWWYVRFQLEGTSLRARAWKYGTTEPTTWTLTKSDSSLTQGTVGIRSSNSNSTARPTVYFERFRVQSVGMTVQVWMYPTKVDGFLGETGENYVHWLGKGTSGQTEWAFRFYPYSSSRPDELAYYVWISRVTMAHREAITRTRRLFNSNSISWWGSTIPATISIPQPASTST